MEAEIELQQKYRSLMSNRWLALFLAIVLVPSALSSLQNPASLSGDYVGLQSLPNLTPDEKDTKWFHENRLFVRDNQVLLDVIPVFFQRGKKFYSASDGGFLTYRGEFFKKENRLFVRLRMFQSDYVAIRVGEQPYREVKIYSVKYSGNQIEINGVFYRSAKFDPLHQKEFQDRLRQTSVNPGPR